jgi:MerR family transcriptional regulator/heat shock protein HspR
MISVASELAEMHPQTLRMYERRGLIRPKRSTKRTRLYSMEDVERLRYIQQLTTEYGLNLAGVERVLDLEIALGRLEREVERLRDMLEDAATCASAELEQVHRSYRKEIIRYPEAGTLIAVRRSSGG